MNYSWLIGIFLLATLAPVMMVEAAPGAPKAFDVEQIDHYLAAQVREQQMVGLSVAVIREGRPELVKGYGVCSVERGEKVDTNTLFAIGSVTKQFTCACILLLAGEGKLSTQDKVAKYYPNLAQANEITLLDLMNHVSGYPDYYPLDFVDRRMATPIAVDELIRQYGTGKLDFEPGTRYSYSNTGYAILGRVVEKASGQSFAEFLRTRVLQVLGLAHCRYEPESLGENFAQGHAAYALGPQTPAQPEGRGWIGAAGGLFSTPSDLAQWDLALLDGTLLKTDSWNTMKAPRRLKSGATSDYGCGLSISTQNGLTVLSHNGMVSGFVAFNAMIPATRSAVVMLANWENAAATKSLHARVLALLFHREPNLPKVSGPPAVPAAENFFRALQAGKIDRAQLGEEFSFFLTEEKVRGTSARLKGYGKPVQAVVADAWERGGMEVVAVRFEFRQATLRALMYRSPDGKIQEFLITKE